MRTEEYTFTVSGVGKFPVAMLSKQKCFPASDEDTKSCFEYGVRSRNITMKSNKLPNPSQWSMYGWSVSGLSPLYYTDDDYTEYHTWPC